jgi:hypothetical protein
MPTERWRIGDVLITKVVEREKAVPADALMQV